MSNKLHNVKANKELLAGIHKSQTKKSFGYAGEGAVSKRAVGDVWIEKDIISGIEYKIEQKNGFRTKTPLNSILKQVRDLLSVPKECPCCKKKMRDDERALNFKMYFKHAKCFQCVIKEETLIRLNGQAAWEEYSRKFMVSNAEAWLADTDKEVEILRNSLKVQFTQNADGGLEEWDQSTFFEKFDSDYQELRKTIITNLKGENGNS